VIEILIVVLAGAGADPDRPGFAPPSHEALARGPWQVRLLPGHPFAFTMYGCPGDANALRELIGVLKAGGISNGFDPGPAARAESAPLFEVLAETRWPVIHYPGYSDMQVAGGRARLSDADEAALRILDRAGIFHPIQLGEWGYYFHNLSWSESWWRDVYPGEEFERHRGGMKPAGLAGYDRMPAGPRACYEALREYYLTRDRHMRGRNFSVTGHSHYEAYAAEWGSPLIGLEVGENISSTQTKLAFARGAARQWGRPWSVQVSPWYGPACTTAGPIRRSGSITVGLDAGHSLSFYRRMWLHAWFAGAAMVTPENSIAIFFEKPESPWTLTSHGRAAAEAFTFMRVHDRGIPYTPVAIVLDHLAGYGALSPLGQRPWGILDAAAAYRETLDLFHHQIFPGSYFHDRPGDQLTEEEYLRPTPYGEMFDVLLSSATAETLAAYPVILLVGDIRFDMRFVRDLLRALRSGSRLLIHPRQAQALGEDMARLQGTGRVEILDPWTHPTTGRPTAISHEKLLSLAREHLPIAVEGDLVQYAINRNARGWVIEVVQNAGVIKKRDRPAEIDPKAVARITLRPRFTPARAILWATGENREGAEAVSLTVGPGESAFVEFVAQFSGRRSPRAAWR